MKIDKLIVVVALMWIVGIPATTSAATIYLRATPSTVGVGDIVRIDVLLDSDIRTNTFAGALKYASELVEVVETSDGNSLINAWVTRPTVSQEDATISYAGITPGGYSGTGSTLFSVFFRARRGGEAVFLFSKDTQILRNDGEGSSDIVHARPLSMRIRDIPMGGYVETADEIPPESFIVHKGKDADVFNGQHYIVFGTSDKGSGIDHYEVAESRLPMFLGSRTWYTHVVSPYILRDQDLTSTIYVKAIDRAGNERVSTFPHTFILSAFEKAVLVAILIIVGSFVLIVRGKLFRKTI